MSKQKQKTLTIDVRAYDLLQQESKDRFGSTGCVNAILVEILRKSLQMDVMAEAGYDDVAKYTNVELDHERLHNSTQTVHLRTSEDLMNDFNHESNTSSASSFSGWVSQSVLHYFRMRDQYQENVTETSPNEDVDFEKVRDNYNLDSSIISEIELSEVPKSPEIRRPLVYAYLNNGTYMSQKGVVNIVSSLFDVSENTVKRDRQALIDEKRVYVGCEVDDKISLDLDIGEMWETVLYPTEEAFEEGMEKLLEACERFVDSHEQAGRITRDKENAVLNTTYEIEQKCATYGFEQMAQEAKQLAVRADTI